MHAAQQESPVIGCLGILGVILLTAVATAVATIWVINSQIFGSRFEPVVLDDSEQSALASKLQTVGLGELVESGSEDEFTPQPYREDVSQRTIALTERELNALVAHNTEAAERLAIDLADDLISARLRLPLDPDFPFLGGKVLKASAGLSVSYANNAPRVVLRGVSVWGVPVPNAWLGNVKNVDLVGEFAGRDGFWTQFAAGVEHIEVIDGSLSIMLRE